MNNQSVRKVSVMNNQSVRRVWLTCIIQAVKLHRG
jgi:hypothetical protein